MFQIVDANSADEVWQKVANWFFPGGPATEQLGRGGNTAEVLHAGLSIRDPRQRWVVSRWPALNPAFAIAEAVWIVTGREDSGFLNYFNRSLPKYAGDGPTYHGAYGFRLRRHFNIDQLDRAFRALSSNPISRQVVLQIWDPQMDLPDTDGSAQSKDVPCNVMAFLKVRKNRLEWTQIMRSNDLFRGLPHNIVQFTIMQEIIAGWLGLEVGAYNHFSDSLHLYETDGEVAERVQPTIMPESIDSLSLPRTDSNRVLGSLSEFANLLVVNGQSSSDILNALSRLNLPGAYMNLAVILAGDALRRRGDMKLARDVVSQCSNPCLALLMDRWFKRKSGRPV